MIYSINKFRHYLLGKKLVFHVDHAALLYLVSKQLLTGKLAQWMLLLHEFDFYIQHQPGTQHAIVDYRSWIENGEDAMEGDDDFPDGEIVHITTNDPKHNLDTNEWGASHDGETRARTHTNVGDNASTRLLAYDNNQAVAT